MPEVQGWLRFFEPWLVEKRGNLLVEGNRVAGGEQAGVGQQSIAQQRRRRLGRCQRELDWWSFPGSHNGIARVTFRDAVRLYTTVFILLPYGLARSRPRRPVPGRRLRLHACRILSPAAGLRLLKAKTQAAMQQAVAGCHGQRMRVRHSAGAGRRALQETFLKRSRARSARELWPHPVSAGWPSASESEDANGDARGGGRLPRTLAGRTRRWSGARPRTRTSAWPSLALAGLPNPVSAGWPSASESEHANGEVTDGGRLARTLACGRRQRTANGNGCAGSKCPARPQPGCLLAGRCRSMPPPGEPRIDAHQDTPSRTHVGLSKAMQNVAFLD